MDGLSPAELVNVKVRVIGGPQAARLGESQVFQVVPRLDAALRTLAAFLEQSISYDALQGCLVLLNGTNIQVLDPDTALHDGDIFTVVPPIAGGGQPISADPESRVIRQQEFDP